MKYLMALACIGLSLFTSVYAQEDLFKDIDQGRVVEEMRSLAKFYLGDREVTHDDAPEFMKTINIIANALEVSVSKVYVLGFFSVGNHVNAYARHDSIMFTHEMLSSITFDSLVFTVAHELSHVKYAHFKKRLLACIGLIGTSAAISLYLTMKKIYNAHWENSSDSYKIFSFYFTFIKIFGVAPIALWFFRRCEKEADLSACKVAHSARAIKTINYLLEKNSPFEKTLRELDDKFETLAWYQKPFLYYLPFYCTKLFKDYNFFRTHPTYDTRIKYLEEFELAA